MEERKKDKEDEEEKDEEEEEEEEEAIPALLSQALSAALISVSAARIVLSL